MLTVKKKKINLIIALNRNQERNKLRLKSANSPLLVNMGFANPAADMGGYFFALHEWSLGLKAIMNCGIAT